jgi:hypothetical protein
MCAKRYAKKLMCKQGMCTKQKIHINAHLNKLLNIRKCKKKTYVKYMLSACAANTFGNKYVSGIYLLCRPNMCPELVTYVELATFSNKYLYLNDKFLYICKNAIKCHNLGLIIYNMC